MIHVCPHNRCVDCEDDACERCGWNPAVAKERIEAVMSRFSDCKLYKVPFTGYCEVWADSPEIAAQKADQGEMFFVEYDFRDPECLSKEEDDELD